MGPKAGIYGGDIVYNGPYSDFEKGKIASLTADYLSGRREIPVPEYRRTSGDKLIIEGASQRNLKDIDVVIPLNTLTVITGVSGSGKTSLVKHILYPALKRELGEAMSSAPGKFSRLGGDIGSISTVELVSQNPIGKSSRSNPITYVKAYDSIRKLFADQQLSKIRGYAPKHFSFNVEGGRCENCKGDGYNVVEMQFLADVTLLCEECEGKRFKDEVLEVQHNGKNIYDILDLSIDEAMEFFSAKKDIINKIKALHDVGLGYVKLGQPSNTLSGGEAQRVKLASFLGKESRIDPVVFIFDEPTTGLHFHDILKLMDAFNALVENGHTVIVVEHNLEVIKSADWIVDLGPGGGREGGDLVFQGTPEDLIGEKKSYTGQYLKHKLN
jgi:excinuclease ABC subunit A